jgi:hypothetical protein
MAKKYDMRLNVYLDENEPKDKILIDFFNKKYSPVGFVKETMYALATGVTFQNNISIKAERIEPVFDTEKNIEEYEEIRDIENIEM